METLKLDQGYQPIDIVPWQRAMVLLCHDHVEVVEEYEDRIIRSPSKLWKMPAVICFTQHVKKTRFRVRFSRRGIYDRDGGKCCYCNKHVSLREMTYDHVTPRSLGGLTNWANIVTCCVRCNQKKRNRTPAQANMVLLYPPKKPSTRISILNRVEWDDSMPSEWAPYLPEIKAWRTFKNAI